MKSLFQDHATLCIIACLKRGLTAYEWEDSVDAFEYRTEASIGKGYADMIVQVDFSNGKGTKRTETFVFEMKSGNADLRTGHGLNLYGERNFVVIPSKGVSKRWTKSGRIKPETVEAHLHGMDRDDVGILVIQENGDIECWKASGSTEIPRWLRPMFLECFGDYADGKAYLRMRPKTWELIKKTGRAA